MALRDSYKFQYQTDQTLNKDYTKYPPQVVIYDKVTPKIARITLNRPEKRNAFNDQMFWDVLSSFHRAYDDPEVRVVVIRGNGPVFSSGHDLSGPKDEKGQPEETPPIPPDIKPVMRDYFNVERRRCGKHEDVFNFPKVTIAQVHGTCMGAGEHIAWSCDLTVAAEDAQFGQVGFGRFPGGAGRWMGPWPLGSNVSRCGSVLDQVSGKAAYDAGLITLAVPKERLEQETLRLACGVAELPRGALTLAKEMWGGINEIQGMGKAWRSHYGWHMCLQFVRFPPGETNFYKLRRDKGLKGYFEQRRTAATPKV